MSRITRRVCGLGPHCVCRKLARLFTRGTRLSTRTRLGWRACGRDRPYHMLATPCIRGLRRSTTNSTRRMILHHRRRHRHTACSIGPPLSRHHHHPLLPLPMSGTVRAHVILLRLCSRRLLRTLSWESGKRRRLFATPWKMSCHLSMTWALTAGSRQGDARRHLLLPGPQRRLMRCTNRNVRVSGHGHAHRSESVAATNLRATTTMSTSTSMT
jgi:hypothetical protein